MRILAVETHFSDYKITNAADWYRTRRPFQELKKQTDWDIEIRRGMISKKASKDVHGMVARDEWMQIGRDYDLVYFSYNHNPMFYSYTRVVTKKFGHPICIDYDDNVLQQDLLNPTAAIQKYNNPLEDMHIEVILKDIPYITVTNQYLKDEYVNFFKKHNMSKPIFVLPNYTDKNVYKKPDNIQKDKNSVTIGFFGSTSHQADLYDKGFFKAISKIRRDYKHVKFEIIGNFIPNYLNGLNSTRMIEGSPDFFQWVKLWQEHVCRWDIGVAPLRNTPFNKSRSLIKWHEYALAGVPMVASDIGLYNDETVFRAKKSFQWYDHLAKLIEDKQFRQDAGEKAYDKVIATQTIQGNYQKWQDVIKQMVNTKQIVNRASLGL